MEETKGTRMFSKRKEREAAVSDIGEARESRQRGVLAQETVVAGRPEVESWAGKVRRRKLRNGFGTDYQISMTPRWGNHDLSDLHSGTANGH